MQNYALQLKQMLNFGVSEKGGMKCRLYTLKGCNARSGFGFFIVGVSSYGGERTFCFRVSKLAFLFQPSVHLFISPRPCPNY